MPDIEELVELDEWLEQIDIERLKLDDDWVALEVLSPPTANELAFDIVVVEPNSETAEQEQELEETAPSDSNPIATPNQSLDLSSSQVEEEEITLERPELVKVVELDIPQFEGNLLKWITENVKYPKGLVDKKIEGRVVVSFIVNADGSYKKLKIEEADNDQLGQAVLRAMRKMPKWSPGAESAKVQIPLNFSL